jgi:hypothetical protein
MERSEFSVIDGDHSYLQRQGGAARRLTLPTAGGVERGAALIPVKIYRYHSHPKRELGF